MAFPLVLKILSRLSLQSLYRVANAASLLVSAIPNRTTRLIEQNIGLCFPELDIPAYRRLRRETIRHSCYSAFELAAVWCWPIKRILARTVETDICERFSTTAKCRIVIAPHLGSWELLNLWLATQYNFMSLYKPQTNRSTDRFIFEARSRTGATMLPVDASGLKQLSKGLKQNRNAMILPDQRPKKDKTRFLSSFFGQPAPTTALIYSLCKRQDCEVFLAAAFRDVNTGQFNITVKSLELNNLNGDQQTSLDYMNNEIETLIRLQPEQYQWGYARFKRSTYRAAKL